MPTRITSNNNVTVWWVPTIANPAAPTPAEINGGTNLSAAISWNNFEVGSTGSADIDDRAIVDAGNSVQRGFVDFGGTLDFFRDSNSADNTSIYNTAFNLFRTPGIYGYVVVRYGQALPTAVAAAGQTVSVYYMQEDVFSDDTEGEDSVKFEVVFLPQGTIYEHTIVATTALTVAPTTFSLAGAGTKQKLTATMASVRVDGNVTWSSSNNAIAVVSSTGVVTRMGAGSVTITANHPAATAAATSTGTLT